jgi:hypothetical protein
MTKKNRLLLLVPALWTSIFDIAMTIIHQPKEYWNGNLERANEANPIGALFMANHIAGLFVISGLWIIIIALLGYFLPRRISKVFLLFCVIAHSAGASTWLSSRHGFWYLIIFVLFNSILYCVIDNLVHKQKTDSRRMNPKPL